MKGLVPPTADMSSESMRIWDEQKFNYFTIFNNMTINQDKDFYVQHYQMFLIEGKGALKPGIGGDGGAGGIGGYKGETLFIGLQSDPNSVPSVNVVNYDGKFVNYFKKKSYSQCFCYTTIFAIYIKNLVIFTRNKGVDGTDGKGGLGGNETSNGETILVDYSDVNRRDDETEYGAASIIQNETDKNFTSGFNGTDGNSKEQIEYPESNHLQEPARIVNRYKHFAREFIAKHNMSTSDVTKFLKEMEENDHVNSLYDTLGLVDDLRIIEEQYYRLKKNISFNPTVESLLRRISQYAKDSNKSDEDKQVLRFIYTATKSRLVDIENYSESASIVNLSEYVDIVQNRIKKFREADKDNAISMYKHDYESKINFKIELAKRIIKAQVIPRIEILFNETDSIILEPLQDAYGLINKTKNVTMPAQSMSYLQLEDFFPGSEFRMHENSSVIHLVDLVSDFPDTASKVYRNEMSNDEQLFKIAEMNFILEDLNSRNIDKKYFYTHIVKLLRIFEMSVNEISRHLEGHSHVSLDTIKWRTQGSLRDIKSYFTELGRDSLEKANIGRSLESLSETIDVLFKMCDHIDTYLDKAEISTFLSNVVPGNAPNTENHHLNEAIVKLKKNIQTNIILNQYESLIHAFKQHHFPLASIYLDIFNLPEDLQSQDNEALIETIIEQIDYLKDKIRFLDFTTYERAIFSNVAFGSTMNSIAPPFYTFTYEEIGKMNANNLIRGNEIVLKTDLDYALLQTAVKFNEIGIEIRMHDQSLQNLVDTALTGYRVTLRMMGDGFYRCGSKFYTIPNDDNIVIGYSFGRQPNGKPSITNKIYEKLSANDYFLSPYGTWAIQLHSNGLRPVVKPVPKPPTPIKPTPTKPVPPAPTVPTTQTTVNTKPTPTEGSKEDEYGRRHFIMHPDSDDFLGLTSFLDRPFDIHLVGRGQYFGAELNSEVCNSNLDKYYELHLN